MTVVGIHPEELFDKLLDGEISAAERERLRVHLDACEVCRFEYAARLDFQQEALQLTAMSLPPALPLRPLQIAESETEPALQRRRARLVVWGLAAAALITASGAVASGVVGKVPWQAATSMFSQRATPSERPALVLPKKRAPVAAPAVQALPALELPVAPPHDLAIRARVALKSPASAATASGLSDVPRHADLATSKDGAAKEPAAKEPSSAAKLFGEANQARRAGDIARASGLYHVLQEQFPGSAEADLSRVTLALLLLDGGDAQGALSGFERYLAGSSRGLEAEALVGRARALGRLGRRDLEASAWQEVRRKYPRSIYGRQATDRLLALGQP
jgi:anti-sigma factor RsiW